MAEFMTRLIMRNDSTASWEAVKDTAVLLKGEIGIEFNPEAAAVGAKVKMKVGDGVHTWAELPYFGGEEAHVYEATVAKGGDHIAAITAVLNGAAPNAHDVAIVKEAIIAEEDLKEGVEQKYQYTAYRHNGANWAAMDGNYSAENVYFTEDFTFTTKIGTVQTLTNGSATVAAAGKSMKDFFAGLFAAEANPSIDQPTISLSASGGSGEVGSTYTMPTATLKIDDVGSYTYGPDTGVTFAVGNAKITQGENVATNQSAMVKDSTLTLQATGDSNVYGDTAVTYSFSAEATHTDGAIPKTNIGNDYAAGQIKSAKLTKTASATFTGYRSYFYGVLSTSTVDAPLTSAIIREQLTNGGNYNAAKSFTLNGSATAKRIVIAIPSASTRGGLSEVILTSAMNTPVTDSYILTEKAVKVEGVNGATAVDYDVYVYEPSKIDAGEVHAIKLA